MIWSFIINVIAVLISCYLLSGVQVTSVFAAAQVAIILAILNTFIKPVIKILTLPINMMTFGLFSIVINAGMVYITDYLLQGFQVAGIVNIFLFALVLWAVNAVLGIFK